MKMLVRIGLVILIMSGGFYHALSQVHIGVNSGVNATFVLDKGLSEDPRYNSTMTYNFSPVGVSFGVNLGRKFGLSLESIYALQGQAYQIIDYANQIKGQRNIDLTYMHLPLLLQFLNGSDKRVRANFTFGPQLSLLMDATETIQYEAGTYDIPEDGIIPEGGTDNGDGTYSIEGQDPTTLFSKATQDFQEAQFQIAMGFGLDIDLTRNLYLSTQVRANYSITDMRNRDVIDHIAGGGDIGAIFSERANFAVGMQMGLHFMFGGTRIAKRDK